MLTKVPQLIPTLQRVGQIGRGTIGAIGAARSVELEEVLALAYVWIRTRDKSQDVWGGLDEWVIRPLVQSAPHVRKDVVGRRVFIVMRGFRFGANRLIPGPFWEETGVLGDLLRVDSSFRGASPLLCVAVSRVARGRSNVYRCHRGAGPRLPNDGRRW